MGNRKLSAASSGLIWFGAGVSVVEILTGTFLAPLGWYEGIKAVLLGHVIGSVFAPMAAILIADYFVLKHDASQQPFDMVGLALWAAGFALYRVLLDSETPLGITFPVMAAVFAATVAVRKMAAAVRLKEAV